MSLVHCINVPISFALMALGAMKADGVHMGTDAAAKELCAAREDPKANSIDWKVYPGNLVITFSLACDPKGKEAITSCAFRGQEKGGPVEVPAGKSFVRSSYSYIAVLQPDAKWHDVYKLTCAGKKGASTEKASDEPLSGMGGRRIFRKSIASELCSKSGKISNIAWEVESTGDKRSSFSVGFELKCSDDGKNDEVLSCSYDETKVPAGGRKYIIRAHYYSGRLQKNASASYCLECNAANGASITGVGD